MFFQVGEPRLAAVSADHVGLRHRNGVGSALSKRLLGVCDEPSAVNVSVAAPEQRREDAGFGVALGCQGFELSRRERHLFARRRLYLDAYEFGEVHRRDPLACHLGLHGGVAIPLLQMVDDSDVEEALGLKEANEVLVWVETTT